VARCVNNRIKQITGIPVANSQHVLQLKYHLGDFNHNDYNPAHQKVPHSAMHDNIDGESRHNDYNPAHQKVPHSAMHDNIDGESRDNRSPSNGK
jgi:hypothetical protein